jgi:hypothetical protein
MPFMLKKIALLHHPHINKIIFTLSVLVCLFWYIAHNINVYRFAVVGALFELAWLPMIALLVLLPIISTLLLLKEKFSFKSLPLYSLLLLLIFLSLNLWK